MPSEWFINLDEEPVEGERRRPISDLLGWCGGGLPRVLRRCPTERLRSGSLGMAVLIAASLGGVSAAVTTGYFLHRPALSMWPMGLLWAVAIGTADRALLIFSGATVRRMLVALLLRVAIAVPAAVFVSSVIALTFFAPEENAIIGASQRATVTQQISGIEGFYEPKITAALQDVAKQEKSVTDRKSQIERNVFLSSCEENETRCSHTHRLGCASYCQHYARQAALLAAQLKSDMPAITARENQDRARAKQLDDERQQAEQQVRAQVALDNGFGAHERALAQYEAANPSVATEASWLRVVLLVVDLLPVLLKAAYLLLGATLYDEMYAAVQATEAFGAFRLQKLAWLRRRQLDRRVDATDAVDDARVTAESERAFQDIWGDAPQATAYASRARRENVDDRQPVVTPSLRDFARRHVRPHAQRPVGIAPHLTRAAWLGTGLLGLMSGIFAALALTGHGLVRGALVVFAAFGLTVALAVYTRGFRRAPAWGLHATFGTALAGLALPPLVLLFNV